MLRMWEKMKQEEEVKEELYEEDSEQDGTDDRNQAKLQGSGGESVHKDCSHFEPPVFYSLNEKH